MHFLLTTLQTLHLSHFHLTNPIRPQLSSILTSQLLWAHHALTPESLSRPTSESIQFKSIHPFQAHFCMGPPNCWPILLIHCLSNFQTSPDIILKLESRLLHFSLPSFSISGRFSQNWSFHLHLNSIYPLTLPTVFQHARGCSPWRHAVDTDTAWWEIHNPLPWIVKGRKELTRHHWNS